MAYIQDISLLMRELLKVPKDYTPTAVEISKYIKSRYNNDTDIGKRPMGARGFSSGPRGVVTKTMDAPPMRINAPPQPQKPPRLEAKQRVCGRNLSYSINPPKTYKKESTKKTENTLLNLDEVKTAHKTSHQNRGYHQKQAVDAKKPKRPQTAPATRVVEHRVPTGQHRSFWNWQTAKSHIRRAVSEIVTAPAAKTKLSALADQHRLDPNLEVALERQRKEMLKQMLEPGADRVGPVRTREVIQKLLEDNKLEVQRREIAKLTELARSKVLEARKAAYEKNIRKREMEYAS
uniref:Large tegument protein n=1 Tax=Lygus hesperus TaxID=30085 RepID=A0A0A9VZ74_LYGHE